MLYAARIASSNVFLWDGMAALSHSLANTADRHLCGCEPEVVQMDGEAGLASLSQHGDISTTAEGAFERERFSCPEACLNFREQKPPGLEGYLLGSERRKPSRNLIRV